MRRRALALALPALLPRPARASPSGALRRILQRGTVRIGISPMAPPWVGWDEQGRPEGMAVAVAAWFAADLGVMAEFVVLPEPQALSGLAGGMVDMLAMQPITGRGLRESLLSTPYGENRWVVATGPRDTAQRMADLAGQTIALPLTIPAAAALHDAMPAGVEALFLPEPVDGLQALLAGQVQAAILPELMLRRHNWGHPNATLRAAFEVARYRVALAMPLGEADLLQAVEAFLRLRRFDGLIDNIAQRYFGNQREAAR